MTDHRDALVVTARLDVAVTDARRRTAQVVLSDRDGTLVVVVSRLPVLVAALPSGSPAAAVRRVRSLLGTIRQAGAAGGAVWDQPVDVLVDDRLLLRRRGGRWSPAPGAAVPAVVTGVGLVAAVAALVLAATEVLRRLPRPSRP